jgi:hypothetical protein
MRDLPGVPGSPQPCQHRQTHRTWCAAGSCARAVSVWATNLWVPETVLTASTCHFVPGGSRA